MHKNRLNEYLAANPQAWAAYAGLLAATITGQMERETDLLTAAPAETTMLKGSVLGQGNERAKNDMSGEVVTSAWCERAH